MPDIQKLIELILNDPKLKKSRENSPVYRDEPILKTAAQIKRSSPAEIAAMRRLAATREAAFRPSEWLFYEQGIKMADYEDSYDFTGDVVRYYPTYQSLTDSQLRGYFSWRTKVRKGTMLEAPLSFVYLYLYELINQIGVPSPEEGFEMIRRFWQSYREYDPVIDHSVKNWLHDYVIYYSLDCSLLDEVPGSDFDRMLPLLAEPDNVPDVELYPAICALSTYHIDTGRFGRERPDDACRAVCAVFRALTGYYRKHRKNTLCEKLFGKFGTVPYPMFSSAVFYDSRKYADYTYPVSESCVFFCKNGRWSCRTFFGSRKPSSELGETLKAVDRLMREQAGFKPPLKPQQITKTLQSLIEKELARLAEEKRRSAVPEIRLDLSRLDGIRAAADLTRDRLIVEEETEEAPPPLPQKQEEPPAPPPSEPENTDSPLTPAETAFLRALLDGEDFRAVLRESGVLLSIMVDGINEKLFDQFGDTVLEFDGETPVPVEDYLDELKGIIEP